MRSRKRGTKESNQGAVAISNSAGGPPAEKFFEGEELARFLKSIQRGLESTRALNTALPEKFWLKQQFSIGVNEVSRAVVRMAPALRNESVFPEYVPKSSKCDGGKASPVQLQAVLVAWDCNPRLMTRHLPHLAASRKVPLVFIKDKKEGSSRLGELVKLKTAIAIGVKARGSYINQIVNDMVLQQDSTRSPNQTIQC